MLFYVHSKFIFALTRLLHTGQKFSKKKICKGVQQYFIALIVHTKHKTLYQYLPDILVQIWDDKNVEKKCIFFPGEAKTKKTNTSKDGYTTV